MKEYAIIIAASAFPMAIGLGGAWLGIFALRRIKSLVIQWSGRN